MSIDCPPAPTRKKEYVTDIGKILLHDYGKKKYYKPEEVKKAHKKSKWNGGMDFSCWGMCTFSSHSDFDKYHLKTGDACDYVEMKSEMLKGLSLSNGIEISDFPDFDIDTSWLDFGDVLENTIEGIGDFISGIFD